MVPVHLADVVDAADAGVGDLPRDLDLVQEARQPARILFDVLGKELERHGLTELEIVGPIDLTHAPFPEKTENPVAISQNRAGKESALIEGTGRWQPRWPRCSRGWVTRRPCY